MTDDARVEDASTREAAAPTSEPAVPESSIKDETMEIHAPSKPILSVREALVHLAIVTVGILIALSFEGVREYVEHRALAGLTDFSGPMMLNGLDHASKPDLQEMQRRLEEVFATSLGQQQFGMALSAQYDARLKARASGNAR
jgi:hypothetical protein